MDYPSGANHTHRGLSDEELANLRDTAADLWRAARVILPAMIFFGIIIVISTCGYIALGWPP